MYDIVNTNLDIMSQEQVTLVRMAGMEGGVRQFSRVGVALCLISGAP